MAEKLEDKIFFDELAKEVIFILMQKRPRAEDANITYLPRRLAYSGSPSNPVLKRKSPSGINVGIHIDAGDNISICIINSEESALLYSGMDVVSRMADMIGKAYSKGARRSAYVARRE